MAETFSTDLLPDQAGRDLGAPDRPWDLFASNITLIGGGTLIGNFTGIISTGGLQIVTFVATPVFDATAVSNFKITLTGNVTSSTLVNAALGQSITFIIAQDGTGGRSFAWPSNVRGGMAIGTGPSEVSTQTGIWDGSFLYMKPGAIYP